MSDETKAAQSRDVGLNIGFRLMEENPRGLVLFNDEADEIGTLAIAFVDMSDANNLHVELDNGQVFRVSIYARS